ncbi:MAG TPA: 2,3-diaminopropionate biosynthesis protein SbnB [Burkholderiaceae bacterium]
MSDTPPQFSVLGGAFIRDVLSDSRREVIELVRECYLQHHREQTLNPDSYFLRFPDKPEARIIALPAAIRPDGGRGAVSGIKWIASYPRNVEANLQRASAVILLNDYETGYPFACLEASQISAARTAASAVLAAGVLRPGERHARTLSIIGGGVIAAAILAFFDADGWTFDDVRLFDLSEAHASAFIRNMGTSRRPVRGVTQHEALDADVVVLATTAGTPWIPASQALRPDQLVLNVSLRDLAPEILLRANNVFDDVEHCMKANTSPHLAQQLVGHRDFVTGTLAQVITGERTPDPERATIFSPFGLGVLDLKLALYLYGRRAEAGRDMVVPDFFPDTQRWSA